MRYYLLAAAFSVLFGSCKLMKKKSNDESKKSKTAMIERHRAPEWVHSTNIYEVNVRQYTPEGTFNAFSQHLDRLKEMGVKTLWFMPVTPIAQKNMKGPLGSYYACSDYTSINPEFGTLEDFKNLVKKAHSLGFKVIIDWVANHTGWDHKWTKEHPEYYLVDSATKDFQVASGMDDIIELDFSKAALRQAMMDAMQFWVDECDIDGFRADLAFWVELDFWKAARKKLDAVKPLFWLGEYDELDNPEYGEAFDASYTWSWMHKAREFYQEKHIVDSLRKMLARYDDLGDSTMRAWFTTNHDENSWNGTEYEKYGDMAPALAVFSCTWNGVPLLYSGQEIPNKKRLKFFEKDPLDFSKGTALQGFYQTLLNLHAEHPALRAGDPAVQTFRLATSDPEHVFAWLRKNGNREVVVLLNLSPAPAAFKVIDGKVNGTYRNVFLDAQAALSADHEFEIPAWGYQVFEK